MGTTAILILAAGQSSRMGRPKQLLPWGSKTVLEQILSVCEASQIGPVYVVLGAYAAQIQETLSLNHSQIIYNQDWSSGMSSSLKAGVGWLMQDPHITEVMIVLADQVKLTPQSLTRFHEAYQHSSKSIALSSTMDGSGPPSIFDRQWFRQLTLLTGDMGAKPLIAAHQDEVILVTHPGAGEDIDSPEDYLRLKD